MPCATRVLETGRVGGEHVMRQPRDGAVVGQVQHLDEGGIPGQFVQPPHELNIDGDSTGSLWL